jgi:hypothetical protein
MKVKEQGQGLSMNGKPILISLSKLLALLYIGFILWWDFMPEVSQADL